MNIQVETKQVFTPNKRRADTLAQTFERKFAEDPLRFNALPGITPNWGPAKMVMLYQFASDPEATQQDLADFLNIDRSGISRKCNSTDWAKFEQMLDKLVQMEKEEAIKFEAVAATKKLAVKEMVNDRKKLIKQESFYENLQNNILASAASIRVKPYPNVILRKTTKKDRTPEHIVLLLSDLHVGQEFTKEETGGINAYNLDIFHQRANNLQKALIEIADIHSNAYDLPELHIFGLGDNVQGGNQNGEWGAAYTGHISVYDQAIIAAQTTANMIKEWARFFRKVNFLGVVGNHGRGGATKNSDSLRANWDNVAYMSLFGELSKLPNVDIQYSKTFWAQKNILGTEFMLVHGDYFSGSVNALVTANQKLHDLVAAIPGAKPFNVLCLGHFHSHTEVETSMGRILVNGAFVGADMHALHHMRAGSRPTQTTFGVHPRRGITWKYSLDLEQERA